MNEGKMVEPYTRYSMIIEWSNEDDAYIVTVPELPGCVTHGNTYEEAVRQGQDAIESWIDVAQELGRPVPPPKVRESVTAQL
ncbi:MAG TPA: type II toxin-antitoxin system HicB family antitoxin [Chloroflexia bacterium]|jgi:predicted RNase H-like HicB family nuclease